MQEGAHVMDSSKHPSLRKPAKLSENWRREWGLHKDFPLFPHQRGFWAKKVLGRMHYFGKIADDPKGEAALLLWVQQKDHLLAGRKPRLEGDFLTVKQLVNGFYNEKLQKRQSGELNARTLDEYKATGRMVAVFFGKSTAVEDLTAEDFQKLRAKMAKQWGPVRLGNEIQRVRMIFRYADDLLPKPVQFGKHFQKPSAKVVRLSRAERGPRDLTAADVLALRDSASVNMQAMILLGINAALGPTDLAMLPIKAIDLANRWLNYPRPKTGIHRRIPLWPETMEAVLAALKARPHHKNPEDGELLFISPQHKSYFRETTGKDGSERGARAYGLAHEFAVARKKANLAEPTFYDLRRTFQTVSEGAHDLSAVQAIMGHAAGTNDMSAVYRQRISDERLLVVTEYVRRWLFDQTISTKSEG